MKFQYKNCQYNLLIVFIFSVPLNANSLTHSDFTIPQIMRFKDLRNCSAVYNEHLFALKCGFSALAFDKTVYPTPSFLTKEISQPHFFENIVKDLSLVEKIGVFALTTNQLHFVDFRNKNDINTYYLQYRSDENPIMVDIAQAQELVLTTTILMSRELQVFMYDPDSTDFFLEANRKANIESDYNKYKGSSGKFDVSTSIFNLSSINDLIILKDGTDGDFNIFIIFDSEYMRYKVSMLGLKITFLEIKDFPCLSPHIIRRYEYILLYCPNGNTILFHEDFNSQICAIQLKSTEIFQVDLLVHTDGILILQRFINSNKIDFFKVETFEGFIGGRCWKLKDNLDLSNSSDYLSGGLGLINFNDQVKYEQLNFVFSFSKNGNISFKRSVLCLNNKFYDEKTDACIQCEDNKFIEDSLQMTNCTNCLSESDTVKMPSLTELSICPYKCASTELVGLTCKLCDSLMNEIFPNNSETWNSDNNPIMRISKSNPCSISCNSTTNSSSCPKKFLKDNFCRDFTDCFNCSLTPFCMWTENTCQKREAMELGDFKWRPHLVCKSLQMCGEPKTFGENFNSGRISLPGGGVQTYPKNFFCSWVITIPSFTRFNDMEVSVTGLPVNTITGESGIISFCVYQDYGECDLHRAILEKYGKILVRTNILTFYLYIPEEGEYNTNNFSINYTKLDSLFMGTEFGEWIIKMGVMFLFVFCVSFIGFSCLYKVLVCLRIRYQIRIPFLGNFVEEYEMETPDERLSRLIDTSRIEKSSFSLNSTSEFDQTECSFCLETFHEDEEIGKLACKHIYHFKCIRDWNNFNQAKLNCPICQNEV